MKLENRALRLSWDRGVLRVENRLSGMDHLLDFPAFALRLGAEVLSSDRFSIRSAAEDGEQAVFSYLHDATGIEAEVHYRLEGERPWFRKGLTLRAPAGIPTPGRVWVDLQAAPPTPVRRVGYGLRGGPGASEQAGLDTYARQPGCGYPVWAGDWFAGVEHPVGFTVPGEGLEMFHHPVWEDGVIETFPVVWGAAASHETVPGAFEDYLWHIRIPRLSRPIFHISVGWSTRYIGDGEYIESFEGDEAFARAMAEVGLKPDALAIDAGWFDRRSLYRHKGDDDQDSRLIAFGRGLREKGYSLAVWVTHNGPVGFDPSWVQKQGWRVGQGPGSYEHGTFVVMLQRDFEEALARRWERLVGEVGAGHLKIDWDNECATHPDFSGRYPTPDHVREGSVRAFNRIDRRLRAVNPALVTRNGWWPSPWWLCWANHVWLADSGDLEYASWPARTQRDRALTHRDACYYQIQRRSETPVPLDIYDNHEFAHGLGNAFGDNPHTWLDTLVLTVTRGTTYIPMPICIESLRDDRAEQLNQVMAWMRHHAAELGGRGSRMVLGDPGAGEPYGILHPWAGGAWLVIRNPSVEPQTTVLPLEGWLGYAPGRVRQVYPYWQDLPSPASLILSGHEVRLLRVYKDAQPDVSPIPGAAFAARLRAGGVEYLFPGNRRLTNEVGPRVHPDMQIAGLSAELTCNEARDGKRRLQWFAGIPHRFERPELLITLRGPQEVLDRTSVRGAGSRYRGDTAMRDLFVTQHIHRNERHGHGTSRFLPPLGPRDRDDILFRIHDGGWGSVTVEVTGEGADTLSAEAWLTGYEAFARQTIRRSEPPTDGPMLPIHPYGFSRCLRLLMH